MTASHPIRVLIVDDHAMVRSGLRQFVETFDDFTLAGEAMNGAEAVAFCLADPPDVVLMDLFMPVMDGIEATRQIIQHNSDIKIIALSNFQQQDMVEQALQVGAISYLLKNVTSDELAKAIREAVSGRSTLSPEAARVLMWPCWCAVCVRLWLPINCNAWAPPQHSLASVLLKNSASR